MIHLQVFPPKTICSSGFVFPKVSLEFEIFSDYHNHNLFKGELSYLYESLEGVIAMGAGGASGAGENCT